MLHNWEEITVFSTEEEAKAFQEEVREAGQEAFIEVLSFQGMEQQLSGEELEAYRRELADMGVDLDEEEMAEERITQYRVRVAIPETDPRSNELDEQQRERESEREFERSSILKCPACRSDLIEPRPDLGILLTLLIFPMLIDSALHLIQGRPYLCKDCGKVFRHSLRSSGEE